MLCTTMWLNLESIMLSQRSQTKRTQIARSHLYEILGNTKLLLERIGWCYLGTGPGYGIDSEGWKCSIYRLQYWLHDSIHLSKVIGLYA